MPVCSERIFVLRHRYSGSLPEPQFSKQVCHFFGRSEKSWSSKLFCFFFLPSLLPSMEHFPSLLHLSLSLCLLPRGMRGVLRPSAIWPPRRLWRLSVCLSLSLSALLLGCCQEQQIPPGISAFTCDFLHRLRLLYLLQTSERLSSEKKSHSAITPDF